MDSKICVVYSDNFYNKYRECKPCNIQRSMKRYYENKDKLSGQRKIYHEDNRDMLLSKSKTNQQNKKTPSYTTNKRPQ